MWQFFDKKVCLTSSGIDLQYANREFERVGLKGIEPFHSLLAPTSFQSFNKSEKEILNQFLQSDAKTLLHLEDDVQFRDLDHLPKALKELPKDWDILYLGANVAGCPDWPKPERYSNHLFRIKRGWTTHAVAYRRKVAQYIVDNVPHESAGIYDAYLSENILPKFNCFVVAPMVAWQRPRYSLLWNRNVDYEICYRLSQNLLN